MIKYTLKCDQDHAFESWFQSADAYDTLARAGHVSCAVCGSAKVDKAIMAPRVRPARTAVAAPAPGGASTPEVLNAPDPKVAEALAHMRAHVEANSDYVGDAFAAQARDMHLGNVPERAIYGSANAADTKALIEDGVPVVPLPFVPKAKTN